MRASPQPHGTAPRDLLEEQTIQKKPGKSNPTVLSSACGTGGKGLWGPVTFPPHAVEFTPDAALGQSPLSLRLICFAIGCLTTTEACL